MPYTPTVWVENTEPSIDPTHLNKIETALVSALANSGVAAGTYTLPTITVSADGKITSATSGAPGAIADASTTVKGASKLSVAPASPTSPIATGDNDPRVGAATTSQRALLKASVASGDPVALLKTDPVMETRIEGLRLSWVSATQISVSSGAAWIPSLGYVYNVPSTINLSPALSASAWFYVYLFDNAGTPALEANTTAPASAYKGLARTKNLDTSRRFLGAVRTDGSSNIYRFSHVGEHIRYQTSAIASPFRVLSAGSATSATPISCAAVIPPFTQNGVLRFSNTITGFAYVYNADLGTVSSTVNFYDVPVTTFIDSFYGLSSAQAFSYLVSSGSAQFYVDVLGYHLPR